MTFEIVPAVKPFFDWSGSLGLANWIASTPNVFPFIETFHLLGLTVLLGTILLQDLRLLGIGLSFWTPEQLAAQVRPLTNWALAIIAITGYLLFTSEADKAYHNPAFFLKMVLLATAIAQHFGFHARTQRLTGPVPGWAKLSAIISLLLWFGVGVMGRAIGFVLGTDAS